MMDWKLAYTSSILMMTLSVTTVAFQPCWSSSVDTVRQRRHQVRIDYQKRRLPSTTIQRNMFTGIVEEMGTVVSLEERDDMVLWDGSTGKGTELTIKGSVVMEEAYLGYVILQKNTQYASHLLFGILSLTHFFVRLCFIFFLYRDVRFF